MPESPDEPLTAELPPPLRLAVAYAPAKDRPLWTALLLLDLRLERAALGPREPLIGQLKLAWWRDRFASPAAQWPAGEPLLAALRPWEPERAALGRLVDGWEGLVGGEGSAAEVAALAEARGAAMAALARLLGRRDAAEPARQAGRAWALDDLARRLGLGDPPAVAVSQPRLPRALRPLAVLAGLARDSEPGLREFARLIRLGLFGR